MASLDLITLADLKAYYPMSGTGRDAMLRTWITVASRLIETYLGGRRLVYRAPLEIASGDNIVADVDIANGALTLAGQPNSTGRNVVVTLTDANRSISAGLLTVTGTVGGVAGETEVLDLSLNTQLYGVKFFTAISAAAVSALTGNAAGDKIKIGTTVGYLEYHTARRSYPHLRSLEWPVINVLEVNEDPARVFGTSTKLVRDTGYALTPSEGLFTRLSGVDPTLWACGWRAIKKIYSGGYATLAAVPEDVKDTCRKIVKLFYDEIEQGRLGISGASDATGNWTRFGPAGLTREIKDQLYNHRRFRSGTGEREFDLEAT